MSRELQAAMAARGTVQSFRDDAIDIMTDALNTYGEGSVAAASDFFEEVMLLEGLAISIGMPSGLITADEISRIAHYQAGKLVAGDRQGFLDQIVGSTSFLVRQAANRSMWWRGGLYGGAGFSDETDAYAEHAGFYEVRYARVPQGVETCDFCLMLASRGFVYISEDTASSHVHRSCDCIVVPGAGHYETNDLRYSKGDWIQDTQIEGFDLRAMRELWVKWTDISAKNLPDGEDEKQKLAAMLEIIGRTEW